MGLDRAVSRSRRRFGQHVSFPCRNRDGAGARLSHRSSGASGVDGARRIDVRDTLRGLPLSAGTWRVGTRAVAVRRPRSGDARTLRPGRVPALVADTRLRLARCHYDVRVHHRGLEPVVLRPAVPPDTYGLIACI